MANDDPAESESQLKSRSKLSFAPSSPPSPRPGRRLAFLDGIKVTAIKSIGSKKAASLEEMGIVSILDLITHYPFRYIDRTNQERIADMKIDQEATVVAEVSKVESHRLRNNRVMVVADLYDDSAYMKAVFFNQPWRAHQLRKNNQLILFGKMEFYRGHRQMTNPVVDLIGQDSRRTGKIVPIYPASEKVGITSWEFMSWIEEALLRAEYIVDPLPQDYKRTLRLVDRTKAFRDIHTPAALADTVAARRRLAFDELWRLQTALVAQKRQLQQSANGIRHVINPKVELNQPNLVEEFIRSLPFQLTDAQAKAVSTITDDMAKPWPMHRLLQGDVGAGKTVVALAGMLTAVQGGHQAALMAPTEVLAEQHFLVMNDLLSGLNVFDAATLSGNRPLTVGLLTSSISTKERTRLLSRLKNGEIDLVVGTHALVVESVEFISLGMVVIDEQHRFGVQQRAALRDKAILGADTLVMTATPIPRTAAMTVFGDLDLTILDELPTGRKPVNTVWVKDPSEQAKVWERVRFEVAQGHQAYVICPLIEGSDKLRLSAVNQEYERLTKGELSSLSVGLLHGQMGSAQKEDVMKNFRSGEIAVLVTTTVIEVGVDVRAATVMVILDANRFGMAQLHQLRGRVGRSSEHSWCYLLTGDSSDTIWHDSSDNNQLNDEAIRRL